MDKLTLAVKIWLTILPIAFINGTLRVFVINRLVGERAAHIASTLFLSVAAFFVILFFVKRTPGVFATGDLLLAGAVLVFLTVVFEFALGGFSGKTWEEMLADYHVLKGRIWPLVLFVEFLGPLIARKICGFWS